MGSAIFKDPQVVRTLDRLWSCLGPDAFDVVDHWECDLTAVGIASPRDHSVLVYYSVNGSAYNAELELPPLPGDDFPYQVAGQHAALDFEQLLAVVREH